MPRAAARLALLIALAAGARSGLAQPAGGEPPASDEPDPDAPELLPPQARVHDQPIRKPEVKLGEQFQIVLTARASADVVVELPAALDTAPFEVLAREEAVEKEGDTVKHEYTLTVVAWETGAKPFPSVPITWVMAGEVRQIKTEPLEVVISESLAAGEDHAEDIAPPVRVTQPDPRVYWAFAGAVGLAALAVVTLILVRHLRRRRAFVTVAPVIDTRTAEEIALARLHDLGKSPLVESSDRRPFYFVLTEVLRDYLGRRYGFDALDQHGRPGRAKPGREDAPSAHRMTSSELLARLEASAPAPIRQAVGAWLAGCDLVKYAKAPASREEAEAALAAGVALVEQARPAPPPAAEPAQEVAHVA